MLAVQASLLTLLGGKKQFLIPIYQRTYSWTEKQCRQLWDDIVRTASDDKIPAHFIGSVVYIASSVYQSVLTPQLLVIDGQQRLTTLSLLIIALREALKASDGSAEFTPALLDEYLINQNSRDELKHKLVLTQSDKTSLAALIDGKPLPESPSLRIVQNYRFFQSQIQASPLSLDRLFCGIQKLMLVDISLDRSHDNPQLIFESLNSTGLDLSQADLIRNFILMGQEPTKQTDLYNDYWYPMERSFADGDAGLFDRFMRDYLTIKMGRIPNMDAVYAEFKGYVQGQPDLTIEEVVADVHAYSRWFVSLANASDTDQAVRGAIEDINRLKVDVAYPFLMEAYRDYQQNVLARTDFLHVLRLVESYVFRRAICEIPTNSLNKTFAGLSREIRLDNYLDSFQVALLTKDSYRRFPRDDEFKRQFVARDVYNFRSRNYYLAKLENHGRKEPVCVDAYTIEHILPQNPELRPEWQRTLGADWKEIQSRLLHTLGNLTLTGYNSEYSDRPFSEKRDMEWGFRDSPLSLNHGLGKLDTWGEVEILQRAESLAQKAVTVWPWLTLSPDALARHQPSPVAATSATGYTLADYAEYLQDDILALFQELRKRVLNLDVSVREEVKKFYIAYKTTTNFVDVIPQKRRLLLLLNLRFDEIEDPKGLCRNVTNIGRWGNGDVETGIRSLEEMEDVMALVRQSFDKHREDAD